VNRLYLEEHTRYRHYKKEHMKMCYSGCSYWLPMN